MEFARPFTLDVGDDYNNTTTTTPLRIDEDEDENDDDDDTMSLLPVWLAAIVVVVVGFGYLGVVWCFGHNILEMIEAAISYALLGGGTMMYLYYHGPVTSEGNLDPSLCLFASSLVLQMLVWAYTFFGGVRDGDMGTLLALSVSLYLEGWGLAFTIVEWKGTGRPPTNVGWALTFVAAAILWGSFCLLRELWWCGERWWRAYKVWEARWPGWKAWWNNLWVDFPGWVALFWTWWKWRKAEAKRPRRGTVEVPQAQSTPSDPVE